MRLQLCREKVDNKIYKPVVLDYSPKSANMAAAVEKAANEMLKKRYALVALTKTTTAKATFVFKALPHS